MSLKQPVQHPVKYYSHLDAGAPQLADADGVIKTILKACLVTGYGAKEGAGWTSLFDDPFRIVLRRPLGTGNPPDIKIENGIINGTASHRIVSQDNPTGLDDATKLAAVNLLARSKYTKSDWHLVVSDFGFMLCYEMGEDYTTISNGKSFLYVGSVKKIDESKTERFVASTSVKIARSGIAGTWMTPLFMNSSDNYFKDMRTSETLSTLSYVQLDVSETYYTDYFAQSVILSTDNVLPFLAPVPKNCTDKRTMIIDAGNRPILRYVEVHHSPETPKAMYIPIDYWEL